MNKSHEFPRRALSLSLAIYRVTAQLPDGEVLAGQMRKLGNEITAALSAAKVELRSTAGDIDEIKKDIARLRIYFAIAKEQNWIKPINWSILDFEYYRLEQEVDFAYRGLTRIGNTEDKSEIKEGAGEREISFTSHNIREVKIKARDRRSENKEEVQRRQDKLLGVIRENGLIKMSGLVPLLKGVASERTIRNDLQGLLGRNLIKKEGMNKAAKYYVK